MIFTSPYRSKYDIKDIAPYLRRLESIWVEQRLEPAYTYFLYAKKDT